MIDKKLNISSYLELYEQRCKDEENKKVEFINGDTFTSSVLTDFKLNTSKLFNM